MIKKKRPTSFTGVIWRFFQESDGQRPLLAEEGFIDTFCLPQHTRDGELPLIGFPGLRTQFRPRPTLFDQACHSIGQGRLIPRRDQQAVLSIAEYFENAAHPCGDDRLSVSRPFHQYQRMGFVERWNDKEVIMGKIIMDIGPVSRQCNGGGKPNAGTNLCESPSLLPVPTMIR